MRLVFTATKGVNISDACDSVYLVDNTTLKKISVAWLKRMIKEVDWTLLKSDEPLLEAYGGFIIEICTKETLCISMAASVVVTGPEAF